MNDKKNMETMQTEMTETKAASESQENVQTLFDEMKRKLLQQETTTAFTLCNNILGSFEKMTVSQRIEIQHMIKETYYTTAEIICASVGVNTERKGFNENEKMFLGRAIEHLERCLNIDPFYPQGLQLYRKVMLHLSFFETSAQNRMQYLSRMLLVTPYDYVVHYNLGFTYHKMNNLENAIFHYKLGLEILKKEKESQKEDEDETQVKQFMIKVLNGLGSVYFTVQNKSLSKKYFEMAYELDENDPDICNQLAVTYTDERMTEKAIYYYEKGIANSYRAHISSDQTLLKASMYMNMGLMHSYECNVEKAIECYNQSLQYRPNFGLAYQNKLLDLNYISHLIKDPMYLFKSHKLINKVYDEIVMDYEKNVKDYTVKDTTKDVLNVGFVSGDFICHPVSYFVSSILDFFDDKKLNVYCYSSKISNVQKRFKRVEYKCIRHMSAEDVKEIIVKDKIDILFDLSGHTGDNRVDVFALKPAPIMIEYIGYPNTSGLLNMDYRITDKHCDGPDSEKYYVEKLIYLKNSFLCYTPGFITEVMTTQAQAEMLPQLGGEPRLRNGYVTFGCFNRFNKINDDVVKTWEAILKSVPNARMKIKTKEFRTEKLKQKFLSMFKDESVVERIDVLPYSDGYTQHLPDYNQVDIALDTFPYSGTTTSCESLMMGVPVITLHDNVRHYHSQNVTTSILKNSGLDEYIVDSEEEYINLAVKLANQSKDYFDGMKKTVRDKFVSGKVFQKEEFIKDFHDTLSELYKNHFK